MTAALKGGEWSAARPGRTLQEARWAPGPVWTGGKSRPRRDSITDRPTRSSVAIPTELQGAHTEFIYLFVIYCSFIQIIHER